MEIIGLSGYARAGKDEVAKTLAKSHGFSHIAFADKLRAALLALNPIVSYVGWHDNAGHRILPTEDTYVTVENVINAYGWDGYKSSEYEPEIRRLLQRLGSVVGRQILGVNICVIAALTGWPDDAKIAVSDVRFPNEAQRIKDMGGVIWRVNRPGVGPANSHPSETALDDWDFDWVYENRSDLGGLATDISIQYGFTRV
jgi:hypothetical protein